MLGVAMTKLFNWLLDLQKKGFEYITISEVLNKIAQIQRSRIK